jgi:radical SAM superfamily enzyme YgiQ (UPF0313 family)
MALATAMYHSQRSPLARLDRKTSAEIPVVKGEIKRRLQKAFLRFHDPDNWAVLRSALVRMGRRSLIGQGKDCLVPPARPGHQARPESRATRAKPRSGQSE